MDRSYESFINKCIYKFIDDLSYVLWQFMTSLIIIHYFMYEMIDDFIIVFTFSFFFFFKCLFIVLIVRDTLPTVLGVGTMFIVVVLIMDVDLREVIVHMLRCIPMNMTKTELELLEIEQTDK